MVEGVQGAFEMFGTSMETAMFTQSWHESSSSPRRQRTEGGNVLGALVVGLLALMPGETRADPSADLNFENTTLRPGDTSSYTLNIDSQGIPGSGLVAAVSYEGESPLPDWIQPTGHDVFTDCGDACGSYEAPSVFEERQVNTFNQIGDNNALMIGMAVSIPDNLGIPEPQGIVLRQSYTVRSDTAPGIYTHSLASVEFSVFDGDSGYFTYHVSILTSNSVTILPMLGDVNADGVVDAGDIGPFVDVLLGSNTDPMAFSAADVNEDGNADGRDVSGFVGIVIAG